MVFLKQLEQFRKHLKQASGNRQKMLAHIICYYYTLCVCPRSCKHACCLYARDQTHTHTHAYDSNECFTSMLTRRNGNKWNRNTCKLQLPLTRFLIRVTENVIQMSVLPECTRLFAKSMKSNIECILFSTYTNYYNENLKKKLNNNSLTFHKTDKWQPRYHIRFLAKNT